MKLAISVLQAKDQIKEIDALSPDYLHLDIMDGKFVQNKTWEINEIKPLVSGLNSKLDVHIMVSDVKKYIDDYKILNPSFITFHYEAVDNPIEIINYIKSNNIKVGMSIKPNTSVSEIKKFLPYLDLVLVMSVEPGLGGQKFINSAIDKVEELNELKGNYLIEVDGGINDMTINYIKNADIVVVGSFITNGKFKEQIKKLKIN